MSGELSAASASALAERISPTSGSGKRRWRRRKRLPDCKSYICIKIRPSTAAALRDRPGRLAGSLGGWFGLPAAIPDEGMCAVVDRLVADAGALMAEGIGFAAICSNDADAYPADSFEAMQRLAQAHAFPFPYLHDEDQSVARAYGAVCTPDFFGYGAHCRLKYRGRLDEGRTSPPPAGARRELLEAMRAIAATGEAPPGQVPSVGCSIKWKAAA